MSDPTQFIVNLWVAHRLLSHEGLIATGRDLITQAPSSLHSYTDKFKRNYTMQLFQSVDSDFVSSKLSTIAKSAHSASISNLIRPLFLTTRKSSKTHYELAVFYEAQGIGQLTLADLLQAKRSSNQKFQTDEICAFFWQIADFLILCCKSNSQYLDISPLNIYCKIDGYYGYNFFISNYGRANNKQIYHHPSDLFYKGQKNHQNLLSAAMFTFGMVLLELTTMISPQDLYTKAVINEKALQKRIEAAKITADKMISSAIVQLLDLNESKRLKATDIFKNEEWLKLRKVTFSQSKPDFFNYRNFEGVVQFDKKTSIGEALDHNLAMLRGTFINGAFEGRGVRQSGSALEAGIFMEGQLTEGQSISKNSHIDIGKFKNGLVQQGTRLFLNISSISKEGRTLVGFVGQFEGGEPRSGRCIYSDSSEQVL